MSNHICLQQNTVCTVLSTLKTEANNLSECAVQCVPAVPSTIYYLFRYTQLIWKSHFLCPSHGGFSNIFAVNCLESQELKNISKKKLSPINSCEDMDQQSVPNVRNCQNNFLVCPNCTWRWLYLNFKMDNAFLCLLHLHWMQVLRAHPVSFISLFFGFIYQTFSNTFCVPLQLS